MIEQAIDIGILRKTVHEKLPDLRQRYGIKSLGVFGSHVRGRITKRSDIKLLVEFDNRKTVTLIGFVALERELGALLGRRVDLVERETLKPAIGRRVPDEVVLI